MSETELEEGWRYIRVLCHGTVTDGKKKSVRLEYITPEGERTNIRGDYGLKASSLKNRSAYPATFYKVAAKIDDENPLGTIRWHLAKPDGTLDSIDKGEAAAIRLAHEANETVYSAWKQAEKANNDKDSILHTLDPLRKAWWETNQQGRRALEARILNYLRDTRDYVNPNIWDD